MQLSYPSPAESVLLHAMARTQSIVLAGATLLSVLATPGRSAIFDRDDRAYASVAPGSAYSPVGLVVEHGLVTWRTTTGFLVDDCHVLTTHGILGRNDHPLGRRLSFRTARGTPEQRSSRATVIAAGSIEQNQTSGEKSVTGRGDWLLLRLDQCLGARVGHVALKVGPYIPYELRTLRSAGYPRDRRSKERLTTDPACRVFWLQAAAWGNDCATVRGDAGDPIFRFVAVDGKPQMVVYAMQSGAWSVEGPMPRTPGHENQAVPMSLVAPQIEHYLALSARDRLASAF